MKATNGKWTVEGTVEEIKSLMNSQEVVPRVKEKYQIRHTKKATKHWGWSEEEDNIVKVNNDKPIAIVRRELKKAGFIRTIQAIKSRKSLLSSIDASNIEVPKVEKVNVERKRKTKHGFTSKKWQPNEDSILKRMWKSGATVETIRKELKIFGSIRTRNSVRCRINIFFGKR